MSSDGPTDPAAAVSRAMSMRASDADREKVAATLRDTYAEGRLSLAEHEERLSEAYRATTYAELIPVLRDLPVPPGTIVVPQEPDAAVSPSSNSRVVVRGDNAGGSNSSMLAIFGGHSMPKTSAPPGSPVLVIKGAAVFGGIDVKRA